MTASPQETPNASRVPRLGTPSRGTLAAACCVVAAALVGCKSAPLSPLPTYPGLSPEQAVERIRQRSDAIRKVQAEADVTLTDAQGKQVKLDAALLLARPDSMRLRTWKLGQAVIDLTSVGRDAWLWIGRPEAEAAKAIRRESILWWPQMFLHAGFQESIVRPDTDPPDVLRTRILGGTAGAEYVYDRRTLTLRRAQIWVDGVETRIDLSEYRMVGDIPWPGLIVMETGGGRIDIRFKDVTLNGDLPPTAFKPPARAEKLK